MPASTRPKPTFAELVTVLDDGTTHYDILFALNYVKKERARATAKNARVKNARSNPGDSESDTPAGTATT